MDWSRFSFWLTREKFQKKWKVILAGAIVLCFVLIPLQMVLLGQGPTHRGGLLGRFVDNMIRRILLQRTVRLHEMRFQNTLGYPIPELDPRNRPNQVGAPVLTNAWLVESLIGFHERHQSFSYFLKSMTGENASCPLHVWSPPMGDWYRPIEWPLYHKEKSHRSNQINSNTSQKKKTYALMADDEYIDGFVS